MNTTTLMGRLTKDVELRYAGASNTAVCNFTLAVNRRFKKDGQPDADFINCQAWGKTAEFISKYFTKGRQIAIVGRIQTRSWDDNEGKKHYATEVVAEEVCFADSKKSEGTQEEQPQGTFEIVDNDDDLPF